MGSAFVSHIISFCWIYFCLIQGLAVKCFDKFLGNCIFSSGRSDLGGF